MVKTEFEYLNKLLVILDACTADMILNLSSIWGEEDYDATKNIKAFKIKPFLDSDRDRNIIINKVYKKEVIKILAEYFDDGDYYHFKINSREKLISLGYDNCVINFLHPEFFKLTEEHFKIMNDSKIVFTENIED